MHYNIVILTYLLHCIFAVKLRLQLVSSIVECYLLYLPLMALPTWTKVDMVRNCILIYLIQF